MSCFIHGLPIKWTLLPCEVQSDYLYRNGRIEIFSSWYLDITGHTIFYYYYYFIIVF